MKIDDLPVYMLSSLDMQELIGRIACLICIKILSLCQLLIFRTLHKIQKINKINLDKLNVPKYASELLEICFMMMCHIN